MKRVLLAFDSNHFSEGALEIARELSERKRILLTGIFLPQVITAIYGVQIAISI